MSANRRRGEVMLGLGGTTHRLALTLGALAELESALGAPDLPALGARLEAGRPGARDISALLGAAIRGGGGRLTDTQVAALPLAGELPAILAALTELLALTFGAPDPSGVPDRGPEGDGESPP